MNNGTIIDFVTNDTFISCLHFIKYEKENWFREKIEKIEFLALNFFFTYVCTFKNKNI